MLSDVIGRRDLHSKEALGFKVPEASMTLPLQLKQPMLPSLSFFLSFLFSIYLFLEGGEGKEKEGERNVSVWLPLAHSILGTWPATHACALTGNRTSDLLVCSPALNLLSHPSQGYSLVLYRKSLAD